jgi:hypothetical protein
MRELIEAKSFIWRMVLLLLVLSGITYGVSRLGGDDFWRQFCPQLLATAFGIIITAILAYSVWLNQENTQKQLRRQNLMQDMRFEIDENLNRLANLEDFLTTGSDDQHERGLRVQGLRTAVMKCALSPENVRVLRNSDLEDETDWVGKQCEEFDHALTRGFGQYFADLAGEQTGEEKTSLDPRTRFWKEISPHVDFLRVILKQLDEKLNEHETRKGGKTNFPYHT